MPLQLLPGPVLVPCYTLVIVSGKNKNVPIAKRQFRIVANIVSKAQPYNGLRKIVGVIILCAKLQIGPHAPFIAKPGLVKITQPYLLSMFCGLCGLRIKHTTAGCQQANYNKGSFHTAKKLKKAPNKVYRQPNCIKIVLII